MSKQVEKYYSAVDWWLACVLISFPLACFALGLVLLSVDPEGSKYMVLSGLTMAFLTILFLPCHYTLMEDHLLVRSGILRKKIQYHGIRKIGLSSSPLSSPALSLKRIRIESESGTVLISPKDREAFIDILKSRLQA